MATREYWLQLENHSWDVMPFGINRFTGRTLQRGPGELFQPLPGTALIIRRYTAGWEAPDDRPVNPWDLTEPDPAATRGTVPGATIEAKVGDEIVVHFRNNDMRPGLSEMERTHSLHAHGVGFSPVHSGTYPLAPPDPAQGGRRSDRVAPGDSFDYHWQCPFTSAGTWFYHDRSAFYSHSIQRGAIGTIIVRAGGERPPDLPPGPVRRAGDGPTQFGAVPQPPRRAEYVLFFHELDGVGECLNGRRVLGNTPTFLARPDGRLQFRCINLTPRPQVFHLHGYRWQVGDRWVDSTLLGPTEALTADILEGSVQHGGGLGEWLLGSPSRQDLLASLLVTEGGQVTLATGAGPSFLDN